MTSIAARLDDIGKPAWIGLIIPSFIVFWPLGFIVHGYVIGSRRMSCGIDGRDRWQRHMGRMQRRMDRMQQKAERWWGPRAAASSSSGNRAFDEYRDETLRRLEDEQREFLEFLERLRHAKDKAEFDQFMADRGRRFEPPPQA